MARIYVKVAMVATQPQKQKIDYEYRVFLPRLRQIRCLSSAPTLRSSVFAALSASETVVPLLLLGLRVRQFLPVDWICRYQALEKFSQ